MEARPQSSTDLAPESDRRVLEGRCDAAVGKAFYRLNRLSIEQIEQILTPLVEGDM